MSEEAPKQSADESPPAPPPRGQSRSRQVRRLLARLGLAVSAAIVLVLAVIGTEPYWRPVLAPLLASAPPATPATGMPEAQTAPASRLDALDRRVESLQSLDRRLAALEQRAPPDMEASIAPLQTRLQQLSARLDELNRRLDQLVKDQAARGDSTPRVLLVALADLGNAISSSRPFSAQLASVEALGRNRPDWAESLRPLEAVAKTGVTSTALLAERFSADIAPAILRAEAAGPNASSSFGEAILAKLRGLIVIRRTDGADGGTPAQQAVATAEAALHKGDLAGAVGSLKALTGPAAAAAAPWLDQAQQRLQAEETVARLTQQVSADIAAGAGG